MTKKQAPLILIDYVFLDMAVFGTLGMPIRICEELESRLLKAGFVNQVLQITPLPINHDGKGGELLWCDR